MRKRKIAQLHGRAASPYNTNGIDETVLYMSRVQARPRARGAHLLSYGKNPSLPVEGIRICGYTPPNMPLQFPQKLLSDLRAWTPEAVHALFCVHPDKHRPGPVAPPAEETAKTAFRRGNRCLELAMFP